MRWVTWKSVVLTSSVSAGAFLRYDHKCCVAETLARHGESLRTARAFPLEIEFPAIFASLSSSDQLLSLKRTLIGMGGCLPRRGPQEARPGQVPEAMYAARM
jgi:hypothetical protein